MNGEWGIYGGVDVPGGCAAFFASVFQLSFQCFFVQCEKRNFQNCFLVNRKIKKLHFFHLVFVKTTHFEGLLELY